MAGIGGLGLLPTIGKFTLGDLGTNELTGLALLVLAFVLGLRFDSAWLRRPGSHKLGACLICFGIYCAAWQWQVGDLWLNGQLLLYAGVAAAFVASRGFFRHTDTGRDALNLLFELKVGAVIAASLLLLVAIIEIPNDPGAVRSIVIGAPIYGHIRHFNNDQMPAIALAILFASMSVRRSSRFGWFVLLALMGFLLAWSGGRGAMLSLGVFLVLIAAFDVIPRRSLALWVAALAVGALLLIATGRGEDLLFPQLTRNENISSNRFAIWLGSLDVWRQDWLSVVFGFGPDAIRTGIRHKIGSPSILQVHNGLIQMLLEFGIIGLLAFMVAIGAVIRRAGRLLRSAAAPQMGRVAAALILALGVYMLFTGIIYHAIPLSFVMFLAAYLFHFEPGDPAATASRGVPQRLSQRSGSENTIRNVLPPSARV